MGVSGFIMATKKLFTQTFAPVTFTVTWTFNDEVILTLSLTHRVNRPLTGDMVDDLYRIVFRRELR